MGGSSAVGATNKNLVEFTTEGPATVKIWWVAGGDGREIDLWGADGTKLQTTTVGAVKNSAYISTIEIAAAGKYYIGSSAGSNYYFKVEVREPVAAAPTITTYALNASTDLAAMAQGAKADGDADKVGTDEFFTLHYSAKTKIDGSILLITHDLGVIAEMADYVVVMYAGKVIEQGTVMEIFQDPRHP